MGESRRALGESSSGFRIRVGVSNLFPTAKRTNCLAEMRGVEPHPETCTNIDTANCTVFTRVKVAPKYKKHPNFHLDFLLLRAL